MKNSLRTLTLATVVILLGSTGCLRSTTEGPGDGGAGGGAPGSLQLEISPASVTIPVKESIAVRAMLVSASGQTEDATSGVTWSSDRAGVFSVNGGVISGLGAGDGTLRAQVGEKVATAAVKVIDDQVVGLELRPSLLQLATGATGQVTVFAQLSSERLLEVTALSSWTVEPVTGVISVSATGAVQALGAGSATLRATYAGATASIPVTVGARSLKRLSLNPGMTSLAVGNTAAFTLTGTFDDQTTAELTGAARWTASNPAVMVVQPGLVRGMSSGTATITATLEGLSATATVEVRTVALTRVALAPGVATTSVGSNQAFRATGFYADGSTADVTSSATFAVAPSSVASISNAAGTKGVATGLTPGQATVTAQLGALQGTAQLEVKAPTLTALQWSPSSFTLKVGLTATASLSATYANGAKVDVTGQVTLSSDNAQVAQVQAGSGVPTVLLSAAAVGSTVVRARFGGLEAAAPVTVGPAPTPLVSLTVAPGQVNLVPGRSLAVRAMARFGDGHVEDISDQASWTSSSTAVASVTSGVAGRGLVTAANAGTATITANFQALTAQATVVVAPRSVVAFSLSPSQLRMPKENYEYIEATLAYSDGTTEDVSTLVTWSSSNASAASVEVSQGAQGDYAYVVSAMPGTATLTATTSTGRTATCQVTVTNATLTSLEISPAQPRLAPGGSADLSAVGIFSDLTTMNLKYWASWTSSNPAVAQVDNSQGYSRGKLKALSAGTTIVTANFDGVVATTVVTVSAATLTQIQVTPFALTLPVGFDTQLQATAIFSDNTTQDITYEASWTSSAPAALSVNSYGQARPTQPGLATVRATWQGVTGQEPITVTGAALQTIVVTPASSTIGVQAVKQLFAAGTFSDGSTMDVTVYVTWLSSDQAVARVSNAYYSQGQAKGLSAGTTTITAARGLVGGNTTLTVTP